MIARVAGIGPERRRVAAALEELVAALPAPLAPLARGVAGLEAELDLVARDAAGGAVIVRLADPGEDLAALADLVAQCAWLAPRLADWLRLAPALGLVPERGARGLLVAPVFDPRTREAAGALPGISLARVLALEWRGESALAIEPLAAGPARLADPPRVHPPDPFPPPPGEGPAPEGKRRGPPFRSGLRDEDLGLPRRPSRVVRGA